LILELSYQEPENSQPVFTDPPLKIKQNKQAPITNCSGIALASNLINRLDIPAL